MPSDAALYEWLRIAIFACFVYLLSNYAIFFVLAVVGVVENGLRHLQSRAEDFDTLSLSRFTIPVSVLVPAYDEASVIAGSVESLLAIDYPEFEVIVVNDGSGDDTLERLKTHFDLEPRQVFYRRILVTGGIRAVYRSRREPRLLVVDKENGGKADALNCAVNFARYRYLCCVDADSFYEQGALLQAMRLALKDPARVVGVTSPVAISSHPERWHDADVGKQHIDPRPLASFQHLDHLRSFLNNRVAWSRWKFMLCNSGAFAIWRRDVVVELGGFARNFSCEDIEMTFRVHQRYLAEKRPYEILCMPEVVAVTEAPDKVRNLIRQRARWQRVISETLWSYRRMLFNPRYKTVGLMGMPYLFALRGRRAVRGVYRTRESSSRLVARCDRLALVLPVRRHPLLGERCVDELGDLLRGPPRPPVHDSRAPRVRLSRCRRLCALPAFDFRGPLARVHRVSPWGQAVAQVREKPPSSPFSQRPRRLIAPVALRAEDTQPVGAYRQEQGRRRLRDRPSRAEQSSSASERISPLESKSTTSKP